MTSKSIRSRIMVLLSKLFLFALIPCSVVGILKPPKSQYDMVKDSLEKKLKLCITDQDKVAFLLGDAIAARLSRLSNNAENTNIVKTMIDRIEENKMNLENYKRKNEVSEGLFHACLTRQALTNLETNAIPPMVYSNKNLSLYLKWMIALTMYQTPMLEAILRDIDSAGLTPRQFAIAVDKLHSLISAKFAHPQLEQYDLPKTDEEIKMFCSFVDELNLDWTMTGEELSEEQRAIHINAAHLACSSAFKHPELLTDPKQEKELAMGSTEKYAAVIIIHNADVNVEVAVQGHLEKLLEEDEFKGKVQQKQVKKIAIEKYDFKDPNNVEKGSAEFNLAIRFLCDVIPTATWDKENNFGNKIRKRISELFNNKKMVTVLPTLTAYVRDDEVST